MAEQWWSIEVRNGIFSADRWRSAHGEALIEAALTHKARRWRWHQQEDWGLVLEIAFPAEEDWERYRSLPGVGAALDAVPDPVNGLYIYSGRGGSAGSPDRVRPKPHQGAGGATLPENTEPIIIAHAS
jgi:hypothetical protein